MRGCIRVRAKNGYGRWVRHDALMPVHIVGSYFDDATWSAAAAASAGGSSWRVVQLTFALD